MTSGSGTIDSTYASADGFFWIKYGKVVELRIDGLTTTGSFTWKSIVSGLPIPAQLGSSSGNNVFFETPVVHNGTGGMAAGRITNSGTFMITEGNALSNVDINITYICQ